MLLKMIVISLCIHQFAQFPTSTAAPTADARGDDEFQLDDDFFDDDVEFQLDDMILSREQMDDLFQPPTRKNGVKNLEKLWPNKTVPYLISERFNTSQRELILNVLEIISTNTCIKFEELSNISNFTDNELAYANVMADDRECSSQVGYNGGILNLKLALEGCLDVGRILHEFLHALGFYHMHTTVNRDDYVTIMWENIKPDFFGNFEPFGDDLTMLDTPYDYDSITHYSSTTFSKNGLQTIISKTPNTTNIMGQRNHLSEGDITRINRLYNC